jgi:hypothetical protein
VIPRPRITGSARRELACNQIDGSDEWRDPTVESGIVDIEYTETAALDQAHGVVPDTFRFQHRERPVGGDLYPVSEPHGTNVNKAEPPEFRLHPLIGEVRHVRGDFGVHQPQRIFVEMIRVLVSKDQRVRP